MWFTRQFLDVKVLITITFFCLVIPQSSNSASSLNNCRVVNSTTDAHQPSFGHLLRHAERCIGAILHPWTIVPGPSTIPGTLSRIYLSCPARFLLHHTREPLIISSCPALFLLHNTRDPLIISYCPALFLFHHMRDPLIISVLSCSLFSISCQARKLVLLPHNYNIKHHHLPPHLLLINSSKYFPLFPYLNCLCGELQQGESRRLTRKAMATY